MSGYRSPYEEDNPFADMHGSGLPSSSVSSPKPKDEEHVESSSTNAGGYFSHEASTDPEPQASDAPEIEAPTTPLKKAPISEKRISSSVRKSGGRKPIRASAITSRLEQLGLDSDPLGPLGAPETSEASRPDPPTKESQPSGGVTSASIGKVKMDVRSASNYYNAANEQNGSGRPLSVPLEQAANPTFNIVVGDPTKIGDITSAHTVYKVSTRTNSQAFKTPEFSVTRRYRDFLWLYDQLNRNLPGAIVPPPPEKQAVGRFSENFIEARRYALERMLDKISKHPVLRGDGDFKLFLESESFTADIKLRPIDQRLAHESHKGFLGLGSAFSMSGKFVETDEFFDQRKASLDALEIQLKQLSKAVDVVIRQRKDLAQTTAEFGAALSALSTVELSRSLANALGSLSDLQDKIKELHERQAQQDLLTLGHTVEEYLRLIGSVKAAFSARQKAWFAWQSAEADALKRKSTGDKIRKLARTQQDRLNMVDQEMTEAERKSHQLRIDFDNVGKLLKSELFRFDTDKVEDFKTSVEVFLESAVEAQKEIIEHWEFFSELITKETDEDLETSPTVAPANAASQSGPKIVTSGLNNNASVEAQEEVLETTGIEPVMASRPTTASTVQTIPSPGAPIPPDEANPFARDSI